jgi:hypothetical protein
MVTITVTRPPGSDRFGNPLPAPAPHTVDDCQPFPAGSFAESHHLEQTVEWDLDLFVPYAADIEPEDVVTIPGDSTGYQVHGKPQRWRSPDGWEPGTVVLLKAVSG